MKQERVIEYDGYQVVESTEWREAASDDLPEYVHVIDGQRWMFVGAANLASGDPLNPLGAPRPGWKHRPDIKPTAPAPPPQTLDEWAAYAGVKLKQAKQAKA